MEVPLDAGDVSRGAQRVVVVVQQGLGAFDASFTRLFPPSSIRGPDVFRGLGQTHHPVAERAASTAAIMLVMLRSFHLIQSFFSGNGKWIAEDPNVVSTCQLRVRRHCHAILDLEGSRTPRRQSGKDGRKWRIARILKMTISDFHGCSGYSVFRASCYNVAPAHLMAAKSWAVSVQIHWSFFRLNSAKEITGRPMRCVVTMFRYELW